MPSDDIILNIRERGGRTASREVNAVGRSLSALGRHAKGARREMSLFSRAGVFRLYGPIAAVSGLAIEVKKATDAFQMSRKVGMQTQAVLTSTGGAANVTAAHVQKLGTAISRKSGIDDEAIKSGENMILTFRNIRNEAGKGNNVFDQTTQAAVDMAAAFTAMGKPMTTAEAALQIGKAVNDPVKGLGRLTRMGVTFSQAQKDQVQALSDSGDKMGAQKVILRELTKEFGGSAAKTATPLDRMKVSVQNLQESIGHGLSPVLDQAATYIDKMTTRAVPKLDALSGRLDKLFKRKDLTFADKLDMGGKDVAVTFRPFERELGRSIHNMHLGKDLEAAFEYAVPKLLDAAARAAPKAGMAFLKAWWHAGVWGKLFTVALIARRLGVFGAVGELAGNRFSQHFRKRTTVTSLGGGAGGRFSKIGGRLGRVAGVAFAAAFLLDLPNLMGQLGDALGLGPDWKHETKRGWKALGGPFTPESTSTGPGDMIPLGTHPVRNPANRAQTLFLPKGKTAVRDSHAARGYRVVAAAGSARGTVIHTHVHLDGKVVAKSVNRVNADVKARR